MDLKRRLQLYLIGLIIGGAAAYSIYGKRLTSSAWMPEEKIKQRLQSTLITSAPGVDGDLTQRALALSDLRAAMRDADIDLGASRRTEDSIYYAVDLDVKGRALHLTIVALRDFDRDSTATLWRIADR